MVQIFTKRGKSGAPVLSFSSSITSSKLRKQIEVNQSPTKFGGSVDAKYLVAYRGLDDDFDTDMGFNGHIQFGLGIKDPTISDYSLVGGESNGFECDNNDLTGYNANVPSSPNPSINWSKLHTKAVFSNMTMVGPYGDGTGYGQDLTSGNPAIAAHKNGAHLRRNMAQTVVNTIFVGYKTGLRFQIAGTKDNLEPFQTSNTDSSATYANNYIVGSKVANFQGADADFPQTWYHTYAPLHNIDTTKTVSEPRDEDNGNTENSKF